MNHQEFVDWAEAQGKDMVQIRTWLEIADYPEDWYFDWWKERIDNEPEWFAKPHPMQPSAYVDLRGNVWSLPFEGHHMLGSALGIRSDVLRSAGWLHVSNGCSDPAPSDRCVFGDCLGKQMTRAQLRVVEDLWGDRFNFDDKGFDWARSSVPAESRERINIIQSTYGKVRRRLAREAEAKAAQMEMAV